MLNAAPMANPKLSATKATIIPTSAYNAKRKYSDGKPLIQYVSTKKIILNKICLIYA